jgi:hypothetical protein
MPVPLIAVGLTVEAQAVTVAGGQPWNPLGQVTSISGGSQAMDFTDITGKTDTITQRVPNRLTPGTVTFTIHMWAEAQAAYAAWRNAMLNKSQYNVRVNCGAANPLLYWLQFSGAYVSDLTMPQAGGDGLVTYSITFQLTS